MYPTDDQIKAWADEVPAGQQWNYIARKACEWQRARDAELCDTGAAISPNKHIAAGCARCSEAIREQG